MPLLILFGFIAGAATAVSPCVLPVLPVALSAGSTGGRRRPLGIITGLTVSFTFATVALVYVIDALGLPDEIIRDFAIAVLIFFGISLMVPSLSAWIEGRISRMVGRFGPRSSGEGFWSGTAIGASLGLVYAPCAGPILAGVITVSASQSFTAGRLLVAFAYGLGSAAVLYLLMLGGRKAIDPLKKKVPQIQAAMGAVMILFGIGMFANLDLKFQNAIASDLPAFLVNPTKSLESSNETQDALAKVRNSGTAQGAKLAAKVSAAGEKDNPESSLPVIAKAPDFTDNQQWFNTPGDKPLTMAGLRGRVVLVDFWTYTCINCIRTQPYLKAWDEKYRDKGLTIVGVHTPEFPFERDAGNVEDAIKRAGIKYPVVQDNDYGTWDAYGNQYWPAEYLIDAKGQIRHTHFGEGSYDETEDAIRSLLAEAGHDPGKGMSGARGIQPSAGVTTPESYLGAARADRFVNGIIRPGSQDFGGTPNLVPDSLGYSGKWRIGLDKAIADGGQLDLNFNARRVYLVLSSPGRPRQVKVDLDGKSIPAKLAGSDVKDGSVEVTNQRLYSLATLPSVGRHVMKLDFDPGVEGYAFTFG
ncbi:MAG: cytochrome c biogenesis protein DipZ [Solirubrobacterales bacterium]|nr:cytochrome c biogenesis protein DipZ [Solirubrobacterales bacterium]MCB8916058.1 cytochrome c biogenesis protein DipZ [Thermoleophilales bacterium]